MKKLISLLLVLVLSLSCFVISGISASAAEEDYTYKALSDTTAEITGYTGTGGNITLPTTLSGLKVVGIADQAFYQNKVIKEVTIPNGITYIGGKAFAGSFITGVKMADSVTDLGNSAFSYCIYLTDITLSNGIETISNNCFSNCTRLTKIDIPEGIATIDTGAFESCADLADISLPSTLKTIGEYAFAYNYELAQITLPEGLEAINSYAFFYCGKLSSITIPGTVKAISDWAFCNCSSLTALTLSNGIETIGANAFDSCPLTLTIIPSTVTSIGEYAMGYYFDNGDFEYVKYNDFKMLCIEGSASQEYAEANNFPYSLYTITPPDTQPSTPGTEPSTGTEPTTSTDATEPATGSEPTTSTDATEPATGSEPTTNTDATEPSTSDTDPTDPKYMKGDANTDGAVNIKDATAIQKHVARLIELEPQQLVLAEYDGDTKITVKDATAIQKFIAGIA